MSTITITSKGQVTLPASVRKQLDLKKGDKLRVSIDQKGKHINLSKPVNLDELTRKASGYIKPGARPILDADAYYQKHRIVT